MAGGNNIRFFGALFFLAFFAAGQCVFAQGNDAKPIQIDIPVKLEKADMVFDIGHATFVGDMPVGMRYMHLLANRMKDKGVKGHIVGIFYGDATYMVLNDQAYNSSRNISTGNPYREIIATLLKENVQIEVCAVAMQMHKWTNSDLLPDVKVNEAGIARIIQLVQEGYVRLQP